MRLPSMKPENISTLYLQHILESAIEIQGYIAGMHKRTFIKDRKTQDAVIRRFEIIGEAAKRLTDEVRGQEPTIPWRQIASMRDRLIHEYFSIDLDVVWQTAKKGLPPLIRSVERLLQDRKSCL